MGWKPSSGKLITQLCVLVFTIAISCQSQGAPLGATPHEGGTTFRVWAPFVDGVAVKVNDGRPVPLTKEDGHPQPDDTVWAGDVPGAKVGDHYKYVIKSKSGTGEFIDPRSRQLTGPEPSASSVIVDTAAAPSQPTEPDFSQIVIYELHIGTFNVPPGKQTGTFATAIEKLDYLKGLGVNAVEVMPVHENALFPGPTPPGHTPANFDWGYDAVQLYAVSSSYGTPQDFKRFVEECHNRNIAVILDVVYNHLVENNLLKCFGGVCPPDFKDGIFFYPDGRIFTGFGPRPDYGRPQVRAYIDDNALMWLREFGVDGLRWDSTVNIRAFNDGHSAIPEGGQLLRQANDDFRNTIPKQPQKISIAEDLQSFADLTAPTDKGGLGFNSQWDDDLFRSLRGAVLVVNDEDRDIGAIKGSIEKRIGSNAFGRVIYSENHDKVGHPDNGEIRLPALIDRGNHQSIFAKKRSTLAAAVVLTSPGIPMIFQGQEMLDDRTFDFFRATPVDFNQADRFKGIVAMYRDLIALRRNLSGKTGGLTGPNVNVFHVDGQTKTLAYHRSSGNGGAGNDVIVVVNLSNRDFHPLNIGFPHAGKWVVRFNSGAGVYDPEFRNGDSFDTMANPGPKEGLGFNGDVGIGPYSVIVLSQD